MEPRIPRTLLVIAVVLAALAGLFGVLYAFDGGFGLAGSTLTGRLGWAIPLLSGAIIGGVAWMLLSHSDDDPSAVMPRSVPCGVCGKPVLSDWRLCPHCGARLDRIFVGHETRQSEESVATGHE